MLFEIFTSCQGSMWIFSKHDSKCKAVSIKLRKALQERRLPILKFSQDNTQKYFHNFTIFQGYYWNTFETDICGMLLEYSGNITSWLLEFAKRSTFLIIKSHTINTKTTFPSSTFKKIFAFKIFPGCPEHCNAEGTLSKYLRNTSCQLGFWYNTLWRNKKDNNRLRRRFYYKTFVRLWIYHESW